MRYEGDAVQFTAFAIVAIESIWPNPDGDELSPDDADLSLLGADEVTYKSETRRGFGTTYGSTDGVETARDYHSKQGYYKLLPLNITAVRTNSGLDGSSFSVTFTLDDLLLVTAEESALRYATGLPFSTNSLVESDFNGALPQLLNTEEEGVEWRYVRDEELGLSRYRLSGPNSSFNVEDLVGVNDTVTIWIYHDPKDFYYKDDVPEEGFFDSEGQLFRFSDKITGIIGSGDRRSQFSTDQLTFDETLLGDLGIINKFVSATIERLLSAEATEEEVKSQLPRINTSNVLEMLHNYMANASSGLIYTTAEIGINAKVAQDFGADTSEESLRAIQYLVNNYYNPESESIRFLEGDIDNITQQFSDRRNLVQDIINNLIPAEDSKLLFVEEWSEYIDAGKADKIRALYREFTNSGRFDRIERFIHGLNMFALELNKKTEDYVQGYMSKQQITKVTQSFINGRTSLLTESHGETPYLALKGMVSKVETAVGTGDGTFIVTVTGQGYEKVLKTNEVYYEDFFFNSGVNTARADYQSIYAYMQPPRAIQHLISRWASKSVILGTPNDWSLGTINRYMFILALLTSDEEEENEADRYRPNDEAAKVSPLQDKVPLRGYFVMSEQASIEDGLTIDKLRLFSPVNYLNTTRIQEMTRTLNNTFRDPEVESISNVAVQVDTKSSIYDNAKKLGGLDNFYQFFVDETGSVRYRLSFEAMERTPKPGYMPTIQDYDVLSDGTSFVVDDSQVVTVVDVYPLVGHQTLQVADLAFIGRSAPPAGKVPLSTNPDIPEETLSPELFRYGMKNITVRDVYSSLSTSAGHKAHMYRGFFGQPLKKAVVRVRNNTSYRVGETVLLSLQNNKRRSRSLIELEKMRDWLEYLLDNEDLLKLYIGVDERVLERGKNTLLLTSGEYNIFWDSAINNEDSKFNQLNNNPHKFVAEMFLKTINFMLAELPNIKVLTPEYFPNTYWYFEDKPGGAYGWDENRVTDETILNAYKHALKAAVLGDSASAKKLQTYLTASDPDTPRKDVAGLINNLRFQNFRATSYFIESVSHNFSYGNDATTTLGLNYGQDNLVLLDPINLLPFGFVSIERKMRIGYDSPVDRALWDTYDTEMSSLQKMYIEQFKEDDTFKKASFLYNGQFLRNSSNYMYEIATVREGLDTRVDNVVDIQYENGTRQTRVSSTEVEFIEEAGLTERQLMYRDALVVLDTLNELDPQALEGIDVDDVLDSFIDFSIENDSEIDFANLTAFLRTYK